MICDPAFKHVVEAFRDGVGEGGAALAVVAGGRLVVDVWHGTRDEAGRLPWERDTAVNVFSVSKAVLATAAHLAARDGLLDLDARVSAYWPGFGTATTVADLLSHRAGLPAIREPLPAGSLYDWTAMTTALAAERPWWEPGTRHGYHAVTFGWLVGEVLRRATGREPRELTAELGVPLGWPGPGEPAFVLPPGAGPGGLPGGPPPGAGPGGPSPKAGPAGPPPAPITALAFANPADLVVPGVVNTPAWRAAQVPAANGHATARALARLLGRIGDLLPPTALAEATAPRSEGHDEVLGGPTRFGLGYMLPNALRPYSPNPRAFGHTGAGGALAFADPDLGLALGYAPNRPVLTPAGPDPRWAPITDALYR
ncbi:serine hydrolase domain-containing protein [Saccharothrix syringae]|uniref:Class A beta-lactamase-related serine hydrolase n=1 Tax=Saccharothrix syringae TaxID=103733 RepID=A0A5Q0GUJ1_SACSY|nr:serine hydrolase domain-containing protein [Saccharothrix syringae]QFZ17174.1 class A beta-lactamase-related serine hydrolase [Saccharothrix syringae]